jgi:hypothetical protein
MNDKQIDQEVLAKAVNLVKEFDRATKQIVAVYGSMPVAMEQFFIPLLGLETQNNLQLQIGGRQRDLMNHFGSNNPYGLFKRLQEIIASGKVNELVKPGDFFCMDVNVPAAEVGGLNFKELSIPKTEIVVSHVFNNRIVFQFEDALFLSAINQSNTNKGGFAASALGKYLNTQFLQHVFSNASNFFVLNNDDLQVSLPTIYEVFGDDDGDNKDKGMNWSKDAVQFDYFKKIKNRIRTIENDTHWWWLSTPIAASTTGFCGVNDNGYAYSYYAGTAAGGVAPAFCVR